MQWATPPSMTIDQNKTYQATISTACSSSASVSTEGGSETGGLVGWFGGGVNLVDFTDPSRPREIAFWMRSGLDGEHSFPYAGYWYNGHVYTGNTALRGMDEPVTDRGFDVFTVDHPVLIAAIRLSHMNAQTQEPLPAR